MDLAKKVMDLFNCSLNRVILTGMCTVFSILPSFGQEFPYRTNQILPFHQDFIKLRPDYGFSKGKFLGDLISIIKCSSIKAGNREKLDKTAKTSFSLFNYDLESLDKKDLFVKGKNLVMHINDFSNDLNGFKCVSDIELNETLISIKYGFLNKFDSSYDSVDSYFLYHFDNHGLKLGDYRWLHITRRDSNLSFMLVFDKKGLLSFELPLIKKDNIYNIAQFNNDWHSLVTYGSVSLDSVTSSSDEAMKLLYHLLRY